jgi:hypothetical protein
MWVLAFALDFPDRFPDNQGTQLPEFPKEIKRRSVSVFLNQTPSKRYIHYQLGLLSRRAAH